MKRFFIYFSCFCFTLLLNSCLEQKREEKKNNDSAFPNIVIFYVDDLGYGDLGCYGAKGVKTPEVDKLAHNGIRFVDGHCTAATCTPSRYSLLTGSYAFRNNARILPGDAPLLIKPGTETIPSLLKKAGYKTGVIGKWHLGLGDGHLNWNDSIKPGPHEIGFDYSFLIPATGDRVPCVYVEDYNIVGLDPEDPVEVNYKQKVGDWPTGTSHPELLRQKADPQHSNTIVNGVSRIGWMAGGKSALWKDEEFPDLLTSKAKDFINQNMGEPFFLYFAFHDIHVPRIPNPRFAGKSTMGVRGDAIAQMDWMTGEIVKHIEKLGLDKNTLIIFSSDNGPVLTDGYEDEAIEKLGVHKPAGDFRGGKYSAFEAGNRMPTIAYWPGKIKPGVSSALVNQVDLLASFAALTDQTLPPGAGPDSYNMLDAWLGSDTVGRKYMLEESFTLGLRMRNWKYIKKNTVNPKWIEEKKNIESGIDSVPQLYDLSNDVGEYNNVASKYLDTLEYMQGVLEEIISKGYSREGFIEK